MNIKLEFEKARQYVLDVVKMMSDIVMKELEQNETDIEYCMKLSEIDLDWLIYTMHTAYRYNRRQRVYDSELSLSYDNYVKQKLVMQKACQNHFDEYQELLYAGEKAWKWRDAINYEVFYKYPVLDGVPTDEYVESKIGVGYDEACRTVVALSNIYWLRLSDFRNEHGRRTIEQS